MTTKLGYKATLKSNMRWAIGADVYNYVINQTEFFRLVFCLVFATGLENCITDHWYGGDLFRRSISQEMFFIDLADGLLGEEEEW